jgi:hypothetical protein
MVARLEAEEELPTHPLEEVSSDIFTPSSCNEVM